MKMRKSIRKFKRNGYNWLTNKKYKTIITTILLNGVYQSDMNATKLASAKIKALEIKEKVFIY